MRIEKVVVQNINSLYGRFEIDFTHEAYAEGLFAIVGPSGSGKSSVLDAMCLALYGRTPRITVSDMHDEAMNKNTDICVAEVVFVSGEKRYRSTFEHRRTKRSAKPFMSPRNELFSVDADGSFSPLSDNATQARRKVTKIVGLDYDQFTRSVMLAQFKFAEFLSANSGQRAEILEQVSGTDIYRRISIAVYQKQKSYAAALGEIRIKKETINVLEPEQVIDIKQELKDIDEQIKRLETFNAKVDESVSALKDKDANEKALARFLEKKQLIVKTLKEKREAFESAKAEEKNQKQLSAGLQKLLKEVRALDQSIVNVKKEESRLTRETVSADEDIKKQKKEILTILRRNLPEADDKELKELYEADNEAQIIREHLSADLKQAEKMQFDMKGEQIKLLEGKKEKDWLNRQETLELAQPLIKAKIEIKTAKNELNELKKKLDKLRAEEKILDGKIKENEDKFLYAKLQEKYGEQRKQLEEGQPCPLCGAKEHPGAHEHIDTAFVKDAEQEKQNLNKQKDKLASGINDIIFTVSSGAKLISDNERLLFGKDELLLSFADIDTDAVNKETVKIKQMMEKSRQLSEQISFVGADILRLTKQLSEVDRDVEQIRHAKENIGGIEKKRADLEKSLKAAQNEAAELAAKREEKFGIKDADAQEEKQADNLVEAENNAGSARKQMEAARADEAGNAADIDRTNQKIAELKGTLKEVFDEAKNKAYQLTKTQSVGQTDSYETALDLIAKLGDTAQGSSDILPQLSYSLDSVSTQLKERTGEARKTLSINEDNKKQIKELAAQEKQAGTQFKKWSELNALIGSADGIKFSRIAQGITFDVLLQYANESLKKMSDRYILVRDSSSMASPLKVNVVDNYQAGDIRPVSNLSGGESFVVSMALALGLSEMSSGKTQIDSLFIDEGFASLDENYLELALQTLSTLGNRENKLIGVISHVKELKERIDTQIEVSALSGGRSTLTGPGVSIDERYIL